MGQNLKNRCFTTSHDQIENLTHQMPLDHGHSPHAAAVLQRFLRGAGGGFNRN